MGWVAALRRHRALAVYAVLQMLPFAWSAATWDGFWTSVAPFSTLLALGVLIALLRRRRWAWIALIALDTFILVSFLWDPADAIAFVLAAARLALLLSPPIRGYVIVSGASGRRARTVARTTDQAPH